MRCKVLFICFLLVLLGNNIEAKRPIKKVLELLKEIRYGMVDEIVEVLAPLLNNCGGGGDDGGNDDGGSDDGGDDDDTGKKVKPEKYSDQLSKLDQGLKTVLKDLTCILGFIKSGLLEASFSIKKS